MFSGRRRISYDQYISKRSLLRRPSAIRELQPLLTIPGMISLGGGMPNKEMFPFQRITAELKDGTSIDVVTPETVDEALIEPGKRVEVIGRPVFRDAFQKPPLTRASERH